MDSSRPVLRRTQPKVLPPQRVVKSPPILKKPVNSLPPPPLPPTPPTPASAPAPAVPEERKAPRVIPPTVQIPAPKIVRPVAAPPDLSPASVHDLPGFGDEDDTSSIASSSCHSSPCFKKDHPSRSFDKQRIITTTTTPPQRKKKPSVPPSPPPSPASIKKIPSPQELLAQRKLKISHYGRKVGSPKAVKASPPAELDSAPVKKRCGWICAQSDPAYIAYHDEEWGVPVYDDRVLFELLVLAGAQSEMGWSLILSRREAYRSAFQGFDVATVAAFDKKKVSSLKAELDIFQQDGKLQAVVDNAGRVLQIVQEFGSLSSYMWGFFNHKTIVTSFRTSAQVPVKSSKSEFISKDLVRRGFQSVGPTTIYSFMQAAGMTNDHTLQCFRHKEINELKAPPQQQDKCESVEHHQVHSVFVHVC